MSGEDMRPWLDIDPNEVASNDLPPSSNGDDASFRRADSTSDLTTTLAGEPPKELVAASRRDAVTTATDTGAEAARRTVRYRKPRTDMMSLVGEGPEVLAARRDLLLALADRSAGSRKARLFVAAAEISEQLYEPDAAKEQYEAARECDPRDLIALRAARRHAFRNGDVDRVGELLEAESRLALPATDKAFVLSHLAEVRGKQGRLEESERAFRDDPADYPPTATWLRLAQLCRIQGKDPEAWAALERAAESAPPGDLSHAILAYLAAWLETSGHRERASQIYDRIRTSTGHSFGAMLGALRTHHGDHRDAAGILREFAHHCATPRLAAGFRRAAARLLLEAVGAAEEALDALADAKHPTELRVQVDAARASGDAHRHREALERLISAVAGRERAFAHIERAELSASQGELEAAHQSLLAASLADPTLSLTRVVREILARSADDPDRLPSGAEMTDPGRDEDPLASAAKVTLRQSNNELTWIQRARDAGDYPATSAQLILDHVAGAEDWMQLENELRLALDEGAPDARIGIALSLARRLANHGDVQAAITCLAEQAELLPGTPLLLRPLVALCQGDYSARAASLWLEEASYASGDQAAFAATEAARLSEPGSDHAVEALRLAIEAEPTYVPAQLRLQEALRQRGDFDALRDVHIEAGTAELGDPHAAAEHYLRAALLAEDNETSANELLRRAQAACPDDPIIQELRIRMGALSAKDEAEVLAQERSTSPEFDRTHWLRAASAFEDAQAYAEAAQAYRRVLELQPDDPLSRRALDRAEVSAGEEARVAQRRFDAVKAASPGPALVKALDALAEFDLHDRSDRAGAVLTLQSLLELAPGHLPTLRTLERHLMEQARDQDLVQIESLLAEHLDHPEDMIAHARLASRLSHVLGEPGAARQAIRLTERLGDARDLWTNRRLEAIAQEEREPNLLIASVDPMARGFDDPTERVALALRAAEAIANLDGPAAAAARLASALEECPSYPTAAQRLAEWLEQSEEFRSAAETYERAAETSLLEECKCALWYAAGRLWQDHLGEQKRAAAAFKRVSDVDILYRDVFDRLSELGRSENDFDGLLDLVSRRVRAGGDPTLLAELQLWRADLFERTGDVQGAKRALRGVLEHHADHRGALQRLGQLSLANEDWRDAAEAWVTLARISTDPTDRIDAFLILGNLYERHIDDPKRAEAAFRRVLKLDGDHPQALERLARLYQRRGDAEAAIQAYTRLVEIAPTHDVRVAARLALARCVEETGDLSEAENILTQARRAHPTDLTVIQALASFFSRHGMAAALGVHLDRAINEQRRALLESPDQEPLWESLTEALALRGRTDASQLVASVAHGLGASSPFLQEHRGFARGAHPRSASEQLEDILCPALLNREAREVFRRTGDAINKLFPMDLRAIGASKLDRQHGLHAQAREVASWFGFRDVQVYGSDHAPRACLPITADPLTIVVGTELLRTCPEQERLFLLVRATKIAQARLDSALRIPAAQLTLTVAGLLRVFHPDYHPAGVEDEVLSAMARRLSRALPRRVRKDLQPLVDSMVRAPGFDPRRLGLAVSELGDRTGLVAIGSPIDAVSALLRLAGQPMIAEGHLESRVRAVHSVPEAWSLVEFAISDVHFEARQAVELTSSNPNLVRPGE